MTTEEFILAVFYERAAQWGPVPMPPQATRWPREGVTSGVLFALKGGAWASQTAHTTDHHFLPLGAAGEGQRSV